MGSVSLVRSTFREFAHNSDMQLANAVMTIDGDPDGCIVLACEHAGDTLPRKEGLAYFPILHADEVGRHGLEIEARRDLIVDEAFATRLAGAVRGFFS